MTQPNFVAGYVAYKKSNETPVYLLLKRAPTSHLPGIWQMVTGKLKPNESASDAVIREIQEETGLTCSKFYNVDVTMFHEQNKNRIAFSANFCGFANAQEPVHLADDEHSEYRWCSYNEAIDLLAFPSQKKTLEFIHENYVISTPDPVNKVLLNQ